jgi:hypothetical protein
MSDPSYQSEPSRRAPLRARRPVRRDDLDDLDEVRPAPDNEAIATLIPYRNPLALVGYYLGVFSLIPILGLLLGPAAVVLGILGIRHRAKYPQSHGMGHAITALVLGTLTSLGNWGLVMMIVFSAAMR